MCTFATSFTCSGLAGAEFVCRAMLPERVVKFFGMEKKKLSICLILLLLVSACCVSCRRDREQNAFRDQQQMLLRCRVDDLNRQAFLERYRSPGHALEWGYEALQLLQDSLPQYADGELRAWNALAFNYYMLSQHDSAETYLNKVLGYSRRCSNKDIEQDIARLLQARLLQRACRIADSYEILYDIQHHNDLDRKRSKLQDGKRFLYDYASMEYYITSLTLSYYYRAGSNRQLDDPSSLLQEIMQRRSKEQWRCDFAEDIAFNYAMAYSYMVCCDSVANQKEPLNKALYFITDNVHLLSDSATYSTYLMANTLQLLASLLNRVSIRESTWRDTDIQQHLEHLNERLCTVFNFCIDGNENPTQALYQESTALFFHTRDPYQQLGAVVASANYAKQTGDTVLAQEYYSMAMGDSSLYRHIAPRFEASIYRGLLETHYPASRAMRTQWLEEELALLDYIKNNEKADFELQTQLNRVNTQNRWMWLLLVIGIVALSVVTVLLMQLIKGSRALQREKAALQNAKKKDIERIANVETFLSVLRHDVNPFISYLHNKNIPESMRDEVVEQLVRTFDNIKNWTNLSIPSGLQFRGSIVSLQELFDAVSANVNKFQRQQVALIFQPTSLKVNGDRLLLQLLLRNMVNNALQYTEQGSVAVSAAEWQEDKRFVQVCVQDTGRGMTPEELSELFRTDKKPHQEGGSEGYGSGFGLILCRYIIKKHDDNTLRGCRIWAESEPGKGTKLLFLIQKE